MTDQGLGWLRTGTNIGCLWGGGEGVHIHEGGGPLLQDFQLGEFSAFIGFRSQLGSNCCNGQCVHESSLIAKQLWQVPAIVELTVTGKKTPSAKAIGSSPLLCLQVSLAFDPVVEQQGMNYRPHKSMCAVGPQAETNSK